MQNAVKQVPFFNLCQVTSKYNRNKNLHQEVNFKFQSIDNQYHLGRKTQDFAPEPLVGLNPAGVTKIRDNHLRHHGRKATQSVVFQ